MNKEQFPLTAEQVLINYKQQFGKQLNTLEELVEPLLYNFTHTIVSFGELYINNTEGDD